MKQNKKIISLLINTVNSEIPSFLLFDNHSSILFKSNFINKNEKLVLSLNNFFIKNKINLKDIKGVINLSDDASFTSARAGTVLANSFNFIYNIPVKSVKGNDLHSIISSGIRILQKAKKSDNISVYYNREPNIIIKK